MKRKHIFLSDQQIENIEAEAKKTGISFAEQLRRIIDAHYEEKK